MWCTYAVVKGLVLGYGGLLFVGTRAVTLDEFITVANSLPFTGEKQCQNYRGIGGNSPAGRYRQVKINDQIIKVSRLALELKLGRPIREGYFACHHCDNKRCVRPDHLYEGTPKDNTRDRIKRNQESMANFLTYVRSPENRERLARYVASDEHSDQAWEHMVLVNAEKELRKWSRNPVENIEFSHRLWNSMSYVPRDKLQALFDKYGVYLPDEL
jgi:hypothetical protein